jgi:uncharacterized protein YndB with AHSA1/START domain
MDKSLKLEKEGVIHASPDVVRYALTDKETIKIFFFGQQVLKLHTGS